MITLVLAAAPPPGWSSPHEVIVAAPGAPGASRNRAIRAARHDRLAFIEPADAPFVAAAAALLDAQPALAFVAASGHGLPEAAPAPCDEAALLARPWLVHVPALFRRALWEELDGFDETLAGGEDWDFWFRAVERRAGLALGEPRVRRHPFAGGPGAIALVEREPAAAAALRALFAKHESRLQGRLDDLVCGKERVWKRLQELERPLQRERDALEATLRRGGGS